jgi:hypothetical protein
LFRVFSVFASADFRATKFARRKIAGRIDKNNQLEVACCFSQFGRELMPGHYFQVGIMHFGGEFLRRVPAKAVIGAQKVAVSDD